MVNKIILQFPVRNGRALELEVVVYDSENRPFDNFTSLHWEWVTSGSSLLTLPKDLAVKLSPSTKSGVVCVCVCVWKCYFLILYVVLFVNLHGIFTLILHSCYHCPPKQSVRDSVSYRFM